MMDHYDVKRALKQGIKNTHHSVECVSDEECYCGASDDKKEMQLAIEHIENIASALRVIDKLKWPNALWKKIEDMLYRRCNG